MSSSGWELFPRRSRRVLWLTIIDSSESVGDSGKIHTPDDRSVGGMELNTTQIGLALATGLLAGGVFRLVEAPVPAPPTAAGVMGIVGLFLGYRVVDALGYSVDILGRLGG